MHFWAILGRNPLRHVPFFDFLILILNVLPFLGHAILYAFSVHTPVRKLMTRYMLTKK
jgi:hypothetical protein